MRLSVMKNDSGFNPRFAYGAQAFLNGKSISKTVTADEDCGEIVKIAQDAEGNVLLNEDRTEIVHEILTGKVEIVLPKHGWYKVRRNRCRRPPIN